MVTKLIESGTFDNKRLNLAKIHMVTKRNSTMHKVYIGLNLAKIHMVTKPQTYFNICI